MVSLKVDWWMPQTLVWHLRPLAHSCHTWQRLLLQAQFPEDLSIPWFILLSNIRISQQSWSSLQPPVVAIFLNGLSSVFLTILFDFELWLSVWKQVHMQSSGRCKPALSRQCMLPGMENSGTVPVNWLWVKAGLLSFWSRTTISIVVGFSSLSPLGDSAKAFSCTHKDSVKTDKCYYNNPRHFIYAGFFIQTRGDREGLRHLNTTCAGNRTGEMCRMFASKLRVTSQSSGLKHFRMSPKMPIKSPWKLTSGCFCEELRPSSFRCLKTETQTSALKNVLWCLVQCIGESVN